jgi:hypothetical protein
MLVVLIVSKWWELREETLPKAFLKTLSKWRNKVAFRHLDQDWTFHQVYITRFSLVHSLTLHKVRFCSSPNNALLYSQY